MNDKRCADRVQPRYESRMEELRDMWRVHCEEGPEARTDSDLQLDEFGLSFDWVAPETFTDQLEPYWRYQLSYGGPSDEFRIYGTRMGDYSACVYRVEYWFLDWGDGASITLDGSDLEWFREFFGGYFVDCGAASTAIENASE